MLETKPYPVDIIENPQGTPLMWFHNQALNRLEAMGCEQGAYLIYTLHTQDGKTLYNLFLEAFMVTLSDDPGPVFLSVGIFKELDNAIKVAELLENG